ncbi:caspase family protein [Bradyrhizobium vignae]|uniref:Peptidase C14 caspase catalytic subunit p20 n=1 Tax=Bradyrhizobium vignae TaxID=1549949 RepID=A0A2U3PUK7_9BRAD|nr:caspase family protein [Bradyrhizobium vignae]SPP92814.1 Peptidase C14 caspase catalytic subunit p20 [Bradyrhizobium vignae]
MPMAYGSKYGRSHALVVGIDDYKHVNPLGFAKNDAIAVAGALQGFGFDEEDIVVLLDAEATFAGIRNAYLKFAAGGVEPDDRIVFFFAGHGFTMSGTRGEVGFLVPYDGNPGEPRTLLRWDDLTRNADLIPAKHMFFIMDACYGGLAVQRAPSLGNMRFLGDMLRRHSRQVLTAGKADEVVADGGGVRPGHSMFTAHLLNGLEGAAATKEGILTANGLMAYVYEKVGRDRDSHQTPHFGYVAGDGDFIFDTGPLDELRSNAEAKADPRQSGTTGQPDILVNTASQVTAGALGPDPVETTKELLSDPGKRIKLDDFVSMHVRSFLEEIDERQFPLHGAQPTKEEFVARVQLYERAATNIQKIVILLARWANSEQLPILEKALGRIAESDKGGAGFKVWLKLAWYPVMYLVYSAGIAALAAQRYDALRVVLNTPVQPDAGSAGQAEPIIVPAVDALSDINDNFKLLPGRERNYVPRSEHLLSVLQPPLEDLLFLGRSYEGLFNSFEILLALDYADVSDSPWAPPGRFGYKQRGSIGDGPFDRLMAEAERNGDSWAPLRSGLFGGSQARLETASVKVRDVLKELRWF